MYVHFILYINYVYIYIYLLYYILYTLYIKWFFSLNMRQFSVVTWKIAVDIGSAIAKEGLCRERERETRAVCVCVCVCVCV